MALSPIEKNEDLYVGFTATPPFGMLLLLVMAVQLTDDCGAEFITDKAV